MSQTYHKQLLHLHNDYLKLEAAFAIGVVQVAEGQQPHDDLPQRAGCTLNMHFACPRSQVEYQDCLDADAKREAVMTQFSQCQEEGFLASG